jgi:hypothetical protein
VFEGHLYAVAGLLDAGDAVTEDDFMSALTAVRSKVNNSNWLLSSASSSLYGVAKSADWIGIFSNTVTEKTCSNV